MPRISGWVWRVAGLSATVAILVSVAVQVGIFNQIRLPSHSGSFNCLPSDFPNYRNLTVAGADYSFGNPAPDDTISCRMTLNSYDQFAPVAAFYRHAMNSGQWITTTVIEQPKNSLDVGFHMKQRPATHGWVSILNQGISTQVTVTLFS